MFGRKQAKIDGLKMAFYTDAAVHGAHGQIRVSHRRKGLDKAVVNFVFVGMVEPPALTPSLMEHIWTEAKAQGYVPTEIVGALDVNRAESNPEPVADVIGRLTSQIGTTVEKFALPAGNAVIDLSSGQPIATETLSEAPISLFDPAKVGELDVPSFLRKQTSEFVPT